MHHLFFATFHPNTIIILNQITIVFMSHTKITLDPKQIRIRTGMGWCMGCTGRPTIRGGLFNLYTDVCMYVGHQYVVRSSSIYIYIKRVVSKKCVRWCGNKAFISFSSSWWNRLRFNWKGEAFCFSVQQTNKPKKRWNESMMTFAFKSAFFFFLIAHSTSNITSRPASSTIRVHTVSY